MAINIVSHWPFNDNALNATVRDASGNNDGTMLSGVTASPHRDSGNPPCLSGCFRCGTYAPAAYHCVSIPYHATLKFDHTKKYTWAGWFKADDISVLQHIYQIRDGGWTKGVSIQLVSSKLQVYKVWGGPPDYYESGVLLSNRWYFFVVTYDNSFVEIFINGVFVDGGTLSNFISCADETIYFGSYNETTGLEGYMDCFYWFNEKLTVSQVLRLYNGCYGTEIISEVEDSPRRSNTALLPTRNRYEF